MAPRNRSRVPGPFPIYAPDAFSILTEAGRAHAGPPERAPDHRQSITEFWLVLFSAEQANRCHRQLEGRKDLHLREGLEQAECLRPDCCYSGLDCFESMLERSVPATDCFEPMPERSVPATGPSE